MERGKPGDYAHRVRVAAIGTNPQEVSFEADEKERAVLAAQWQVSTVKAFSAALRLSRWKRDGVKVSGTVEAEIEQPCVVTLEPVGQTIREEFEQVFVPDTSRLSRQRGDDTGEIVLDPDGPDLPETFSGDLLDVGALAAEHAALAIDPYPRAEGAAFEPPETDAAGDDKKPSPFAVLKALKRDGGGQ